MELVKCKEKVPKLLGIRIKDDLMTFRKFVFEVSSVRSYTVFQRFDK